MPAGSQQRAAKASRHLASPSLSHYAALSFVVTGKRHKREVRGRRAARRHGEGETRRRGEETPEV